MSFNLESFFFDTPIYTKIEIKESDVDELDHIIYGFDKHDVEGYNVWRKVQSTFSIKRTLDYSDREFKANGGYGSVEIECKRYHDTYSDFIAYGYLKKAF